MKKLSVVLLIIFIAAILPACQIPLENLSTAASGASSEAFSTSSKDVVTDTLGIDIDGLKDLVSEQYQITNYVTYTTENFIIHKFTAECDIVCFSPLNSSELSVILLFHSSTISDRSTIAKAAIELNDIILHALDGPTKVTNNYIKGYDLVYAISAMDTSLNATELPLYVSEFRDSSDFFANQERCDYFEDCLVAGNYTELYDYMNQYLTDLGSMDDTALAECIDLLEQILPLLEQTNIKYDDFENTAQIYYQNLESISKKQYLVPFCKTYSYGDISLCSIAGFKNSDWIFFDQILLKTANCDADTTTFNSYDITRNVINNGIEEYVQYNLPLDIVVDITNTGVDSKAAIRFYNESSGKKIEQTLSETTIDAITCLYKITKIHNNIYRVYFSYVSY